MSTRGCKSCWFNRRCRDSTDRCFRFPPIGETRPRATDFCGEWRWQMDPTKGPRDERTMPDNNFGFMAHDTGREDLRAKWLVTRRVRDLLYAVPKPVRKGVSVWTLADAIVEKQYAHPGWWRDKRALGAVGSMKGVGSASLRVMGKAGAMFSESEEA